MPSTSLCIFLVARALNLYFDILPHLPSNYPPKNLAHLQPSNKLEFKILYGTALCLVKVKQVK
jgi:hypothetical protein